MKKYSDKELTVLAIVSMILGIICLFPAVYLETFIGYGLCFIFICIAITLFIVLLIRINKEDYNKTEFRPTSTTKQQADKDIIFTKPIHNNKLTHCKTCGAEIAKTAKHCPHCGARTPGETLNQSIQGIGCGILFVVIFIPCFIGLIYAIAILK